VLGAVELRGELLRARRHDVRHHQQQLVRQASKVLGWPKRCQLAPAFLWEYSYKRLELVQLLVQLGVFLTPCSRASSADMHSTARETAWRAGGTGVG
jgi:hypothetical protein